MRPNPQPFAPAEATQIVDRYQDLRTRREPLGRAFLDGSRPWMIYHTPGCDLFGDVRTAEECFTYNLQNVRNCFDVPSDHFPVLEPWFGTGLFANIFGCPYVWREGSAPAVHYRYHAMEEVRGVGKPNWEGSEIARLVLDTIRYFKARTGDAIPINWADTQSAHDTATLILDASEVFTACLAEPELIMEFMRAINASIVEFSRVQSDEIGDALMRPGHIMLSQPAFRGMSISDDNLAVGSPHVNCAFNLPLDEEIGQAMGGVAIHSCGAYAHTMPHIARLVPSCVAIDCAFTNACDPTPNEPEAVRDALAGSGIVLHARMTADTDGMLDVVHRLLHKDLRLIVHPNCPDRATAERNYGVLEGVLGEFYRKG
jgi:hypothetical protein